MARMSNTERKSKSETGTTTNNKANRLNIIHCNPKTSPPNNKACLKGIF